MMSRNIDINFTEVMVTSSLAHLLTQGHWAERTWDTFSEILGICPTAKPFGLTMTDIMVYSWQLNQC